MSRIEYQIGSRIGNCTYMGNDFYKKSNRWATFKCVCGKEFNANIKQVKRLHTKSCGCIRKKQISERNRKHGLAKRGNKSKEYNIWVLMKQRCDNPKLKGFKNWGGRGITVCDRWRSSFDNFIEDMGNCPSYCRGLDRKDNNKNYEPTNCRWATQKTQMRNMRRNRMILHEGDNKTLAQWMEELQVDKGSFYYWSKKGLSDSEVITKLKIQK